MRSVLVFAALAIAAGLIVPRYAGQMAATSAAPTSATLPARPALPVDAAAAGNSRAMVVPRDERGHFEVEGRVDGRRLSFMVDTGASVVALTASDAARLGIHPAQSEFVAAVRTANGTVLAAPARLDMLEVGDLAVPDVAAVVLPDEALSENLLGLSFLSRLKRFEYSDGKLVLEQ